MTDTSLETCLDGIRALWGPLTTELAAGCSRHLETLLKASAGEAWLGALHEDAPANRELYRDPAYGFVLLAHAEYAGLYRPPHDHGRGWVIYAIQQGEIEMRTYAPLQGADGRVRLVQRDATLLRAGETKLFLPGDIHDTRCLSAPALLFRFTDRDLRIEDRQKRLTRYREEDGSWTVGAP